MGWGLILTTIAAGAGAVCCLIAMAQEAVAQDGRAARNGAWPAPGFPGGRGVPAAGYSYTVADSAPRAAAGRVGVIERGRPLPDVSVPSGQPLLIGRDSRAQVRLTDPKASRRHLEVRLDGDSWVIRDLNATNPASLVSAAGRRPLGGGASMRMASGQLAIGESVITLYPAGR